MMNNKARKKRMRRQQREQDRHLYVLRKRIKGAIRARLFADGHEDEHGSLGGFRRGYLKSFREHIKRFNKKYGLAWPSDPSPRSLIIMADYLGVEYFAPLEKIKKTNNGA